MDLLFYQTHADILNWSFYVKSISMGRSDTSQRRSLEFILIGLFVLVFQKVSKMAWGSKGKSDTFSIFLLYLSKILKIAQKKRKRAFLKGFVFWETSFKTLNIQNLFISSPIISIQLADLINSIIHLSIEVDG